MSWCWGVHVIMSPRSQNVPRAAAEGYILTEGGHDYMYPEAKHDIIALVSFCCTLILKRNGGISSMHCTTDVKWPSDFSNDRQKWSHIYLCSTSFLYYFDLRMYATTSTCIDAFYSKSIYFKSAEYKRFSQSMIWLNVRDSGGRSVHLKSVKCMTH